MSTQPRTRKRAPEWGHPEHIRPPHTSARRGTGGRLMRTQQTAWKKRICRLRVDLELLGCQAPDAAVVRIVQRHRSSAMTLDAAIACEIKSIRAAGMRLD